MQPSNTNRLLTSHFRCPEDLADFTVAPIASSDSGYFRFGSDAIIYGQSSSGIPAALVTDACPIACQHVDTNESTVQLPFDPVQVVDNLRFERYAANSTRAGKKVEPKNVLRNLYYSVRPFMPVAVRKHLQKIYLRGRDKLPFPTWPVDRTVENILEQLLVIAMKSRNVDRVPFIWFWPDGAPSCTIMTHDVETSCGANFCPQLMDLDDSFGIKSSFQVVPEDRYDVPPSFLENIRKRGFEVNVHDLNHDGRLFSNRVEFLRRAGQINSYGQQWGAVGFRSAILYRNIDWYDALDFSYDMSIPNVARLDPQPGGCCTVLPYFIGNIVELPVTTTQDYSLFHILHDYSIRLWKEQVSLIQEKHGLISFIIHPDYIISATARRVYVELLAYLSELRSQGATWIALPRQAAAWWRLRSELNLVNVGGSWRIEGRGSERARIAYAVVVNDTLTYEIDQVSTIRRSEMTNISGKALERTIYTDGTYLEKNPDWHMYESPFKVNQILRMLKKHRLQPKTIAEVGCGAGEVLRLLQEQMDRGCRFSGYDISPQALEMCKSRANERLQFKLADITHQENIFFDMILVLDVIEHVEDYFSFLRGIRPKSDLKIFHFPLDISVQAVLRRRGLLKRRELYGHIHYFTKETALATVKDSGYELMDYFYTPRCIELAKDAIQKIARLPRIICFSIHPDLAVRILGGYSLLILAR